MEQKDEAVIEHGTPSEPAMPPHHSTSKVADVPAAVAKELRDNPPPVEDAEPAAEVTAPPVPTRRRKSK